MKIEHTIRLLAGTLVLTGMALGTWINEWWYLLVVFVGLNLVQSAFTKWCLAETIIGKLFYSCNCDTEKEKVQ
jgi:hypothetical protein